MAGGKGKRIGLDVEKPLLSFLGKPLIEWVADAVKSAENVSEFFVVTSETTPKTGEWCLAKGLKVVRTDARGYHDDLKQALIKLHISSPVMTVSSDLPALTGKFLDKVVLMYENNGVDAVTVLVPLEKRTEAGLSVSSTYPYDGVSYCVCGVNVINGAKICEEKMSEQAFITTDLEAVLNVNTLNDLEIAREIVLGSVKGNQSGGSI
jgi:adenosylcobinamide-phosphate guanylyltransferase